MLILSDTASKYFSAVLAFAVLYLLPHVTVPSSVSLKHIIFLHLDQCGWCIYMRLEYKNGRVLVCFFKKQLNNYMVEIIPSTGSQTKTSKMFFVF